MQRAVANVYRDDDVDVVVGHTIALEAIVCLANPSLQRSKPSAHATLGVVEQGVAVEHERGGATSRRECSPSARSRGTGGELRAEVAAAFVRGADVREDERKQLPVEHTRADQPHRRNDEALLHELRGALRHAARTHPADVRMMRAHRCIPRDDAIDLDGFHQRQVRKVGSAVVGVVEDVDVARVRVASAHRVHRLGHRAKVHGNVRRLRHHSAACVEQRRRGIASLADVR